MAKISYFIPLIVEMEADSNDSKDPEKEARRLLKNNLDTLKNDVRYNIKFRQSLKVVEIKNESGGSGGR